MIHKRRRQAALLRLVHERPTRSQAELARLLSRGGHLATQASVSRDIRELGLVKVNGRYLSPGRLRRNGAAAPELAENELITAVDPVGANLVVVRTRVGAASAVAVELDRVGLAEIAGTLAGDDTVFVAVRSRSAQGRVVAFLRQRIPVAS